MAAGERLRKSRYFYPKAGMPGLYDRKILPELDGMRCD